MTRIHFNHEQAAEFILENYNLRATHFSTMAGEAHLFDVEELACQAGINDTVAVFYQPINGQEPEVQIGSPTVF
ncbi:unnamed protein product [marine sediment metagenome]|uniref:Uncharacterized protein n=1 Tax=marine sediment metagenome TaxID=412755 RepID=X0RUR6_9ZZZZ